MFRDDDTRVATVDAPSKKAESPFLVAGSWLLEKNRIVDDPLQEPTTDNQQPMPSFLGLISGTSADGIDVALVRLRRRRSACALRTRARAHHAWDEALRAAGRTRAGRASWRRWTNSAPSTRARGRRLRRRGARLAARSGRRGFGCPRARFARPDRAPSPARRRERRGFPFTCNSATATSSPNAPASPPSPISAAATSPPAATARRCCRRCTRPCCRRPARTARCSTSAASPTSRCCRRMARCAVSTPARRTR